MNYNSELFAPSNESFERKDSKEERLAYGFSDCANLERNAVRQSFKYAIENISLPQSNSNRHSCTNLTAVEVKKYNFWESCKEALQKHNENESSFMIGLQVFLPFFIAGFGMVGAGLLLDSVQDSKVFQEISEMMILAPALLGLKGNLEMTSASRLSTMVNLGHIDLKESKYIIANLALVQAQAAVVGTLASIFASLLGFAKTRTFSWSKSIVLCASSLTTAALSSLVLDSALVGLIILSFKYKINPDNVATPLAASFGDLVTLALLGGTGTLFNNHTAMSYFGIAIFLGLMPLWIYLSIRACYAKEVLKTGWPPIVISMALSSLSGFLLDVFYTRFHNMAAFQPVINGVGGNLAAIQASRVATYLHDTATPGILVEPFPTPLPNPIRVFFQSSFADFSYENTHARTNRVLISFLIPGHLIFFSVIYAVKHGEVKFTLPFVSLYILAGFTQAFMLLYVCIVLSNFLWKHKINPDSWVIPILTALGDLIGTALLTLTFLLLFHLYDENALVRGH